MKKKISEEQIAFNKCKSKLLYGTRVSECLWNEECGGKIVKAHAIQNNKYLNKISHNGNLLTLHVEQPTEGDLPVNFKKVGRANFSTFEGFCSKHDKSLFQPIEDRDYTETKEQKFLFSFRAIAKEIHVKKETINLYQNIFSEFKDAVYLLREASNELLNDELSLSSLQDIFNELKQELKNSNFDNLYTKTLCFESEFPIVATATFITYNDFKCNPLFSDYFYNRIQSGIENPFIFLNVFPENGKTFILISCQLKYAKLFSKYFKSLNYNSKHKISYLLLQHAETIAFSPEYISNKFSEEEQTLLKEIFYATMGSEKIIRVDKKGIILDINLFKE
ncbi:MAG: hypothetical protein ACRC54_04650 [Fusobacteriaceae bacterium]